MKLANMSLSVCYGVETIVPMAIYISVCVCMNIILLTPVFPVRLCEHICQFNNFNAVFISFLLSMEKKTRVCVLVPYINELYKCDTKCYKIEL